MAFHRENPSGPYMRRRNGFPGGGALKTIDWNGIAIVPVQKDFLIDHPNVAFRTEAECESIRLRHSIIIVKGRDKVPRPVESFEEVAFPDWVVEGLRRESFTRPLPIQVQAWPAGLHGNDLVGIAETGSGKTLAYVLPMLVHIMAQPALRPGEGPVGLVLVPTRNLCMQVARVVNLFAHKSDIRCQAICGGGSAEERAAQDEAVLERCDVVVATPGRLIEMLNQQRTNLLRATFVVLDEADELLANKFGHQIELVLSQIRPDRQVLLFSATWPARVEALALGAITQQPIHICIGNRQLAACKSIDQQFLLVGHRHTKPLSTSGNETKLDLLLGYVRLISEHLNSSCKALIFVNSRDSVMHTVEKLQQAGFLAAGYMSELCSEQRDEVLDRFIAPDDELLLLVATQVLGRGLDVSSIGYVINFDMPGRMVEYVHRIGRTGRAGRPGYALTLLEEADLAFSRVILDCLRQSEKHLPKWLLLKAARKENFDRYRNPQRQTVKPKLHDDSALRARAEHFVGDALARAPSPQLALVTGSASSSWEAPVHVHAAAPADPDAATLPVQPLGLGQSTEAASSWMAPAPPQATALGGLVAATVPVQPPRVGQTAEAITPAQEPHTGRAAAVPQQATAWRRLWNDRMQRHFYHNLESGLSQWEVPCDYPERPRLCTSSAQC